MGFIRNNNVWKINKILADIEQGSGVTPEQVQDMIDTSIEGKQDVLTAGDGITIENDVISASVGDEWEIYTENDNWASLYDFGTGRLLKDVKLVLHLSFDGYDYYASTEIDKDLTNSVMAIDFGFTGIETSGIGTTFLKGSLEILFHSVDMNVIKLTQESYGFSMNSGIIQITKKTNEKSYTKVLTKLALNTNLNSVLLYVRG